MPASSVSSPSTRYRLPRPISCHEFCERYGISAVDEAKLEKLEFIPGEKAFERLEPEDWKDFAGFTKLAWNRVLDHHKQLVADAKLGLWDLVGV
jgi:hypothetical protein